MLALINKDLIPRLLETRCVICKRLDDRAREEITMRIKSRTWVFASNKYDRM